MNVIARGDEIVEDFMEEERVVELCCLLTMRMNWRCRLEVSEMISFKRASFYVVLSVKDL